MGKMKFKKRFKWLDCKHLLDPLERICIYCGRSEDTILYFTENKIKANLRSSYNETNQTKAANMALFSGRKRFKTALFDFIKIPNMLFGPFLLWIKIRNWFEKHFTRMLIRLRADLISIEGGNIDRME